MVRRLSLALGLVPLAGCGSGLPAAAPSGALLLRGAPAAALAPLPHGGLLVGALRGGSLQRLAADGTRTTPRLRVPAVATQGQRGLLSLLADGRRVYASWVARDGRLLVGRLRSTRAPRIVWRGPATATLANGGHLALAPDGRIVVGIGDRQSPRGAVGQLLSLAPDGPPSQRPRVLSRGWSNPFAFAFTPDRRLWVADNAPGPHPERLARGDEGRPRELTVLPPETAPAGLAALPDGDLVLCGFRSGRLDRYRSRAGRWMRIATLASDCRYGVVRLRDGRLAYAADDGVRSVRP